MGAGTAGRAVKVPLVEYGYDGPTSFNALAVRRILGTADWGPPQRFGLERAMQPSGPPLPPGNIGIPLESVPSKADQDR